MYNNGPLENQCNSLRILRYRIAMQLLMSLLRSETGGNTKSSTAPDEAAFMREWATNRDLLGPRTRMCLKTYANKRCAWCICSCMQQGVIRASKLATVTGLILSSEVADWMRRRRMCVLIGVDAKGTTLSFLTLRSQGSFAICPCTLTINSVHIFLITTGLTPNDELEHHFNLSVPLLGKSIWCPDHDLETISVPSFKMDWRNCT